MSSDEIFAAQMWSWPGPMLKRNSAGQVIIVNASFLQLYGGRIEDWHGNAVTGWPAPQAPGLSTRFESRIPQTDGSEIIYDWLECTLADGSALAIARDVTALLAATPAPVAAPVQHPPVQEMPVQEAASAQTSAQEPLQQQPPVEQPVQQQAALQQPAMHQQPAQQAQAAQAPVQHDPIASPQIPPVAVNTAPPPQAGPADTPPAAPPMPNDQAAAQQNITPPPAPQKSAQTQSTPEPKAERDFERRALPIENGDSVLGNNWRDAVIAKAVGVEDPADENEDAKDAEAENTSETAENNGVRILLAEDNAINALLTRTLLEAEGCAVEVVEDGSLAVEAMKNATYDMIFMDMRMPNMDGLEATRKIRSMDHRSKGLPIVALTANAFDDDRNACFDSGMNDFMTKPVSAEELSQMVKTHTGPKETAMAG